MRWLLNMILAFFINNKQDLIVSKKPILEQPEEPKVFSKNIERI